MSALNYRNQIILDDDDHDHDNFLAWRERTRLILRAEKVAACVNTWDPQRLAREWGAGEAAAKEQRARQILRLLVGPRLWRRASRRCQCAHEIWLELERQHARRARGKSTDQVSALLLQLDAYKMPGPPANLVRASLELVDIFDRLKALGSPLSDADKIKCIIRALPSHYQEPLGAYLGQQRPSEQTLRNLQQLIVMISQIVQAETTAVAIIRPDHSGRNFEDAKMIAEAPQQGEPKFCQELADPITPPEEQLGVIVHSDTIQSPDDPSSWSAGELQPPPPPPTDNQAQEFACCRPGKLCDPRLHRLEESSPSKSQPKKREYKIPHITKPAASNNDKKEEDDDDDEDDDHDDVVVQDKHKEEDDDDERLLGRVETSSDGHRFKRIKFIFSANHRLNIVNDLSILYRHEAITPFSILMRDNTSVEARHRGYVRSDSGSFSVFFVPTSDNNYLSIKAMNSKFYLPPKPGEQDYSDMRIRDMVKFNKLKDSAKIILKVYLPSPNKHNNNNNHNNKFSLKRHYKQGHHQQHQPQPKHHKQFHSRQSKSPSTSPSPEPKDNNSGSFDSTREQSFVHISEPARVDWTIEDNEEDNEPGLAYDLRSSMEQNKLLSPSFK